MFHIRACTRFATFPYSLWNYACADKSSARTNCRAQHSTIYIYIYTHHSNENVISHHLHIHKILPNIKFRILTICSFRSFIHSQVPLFNGSSYLRFAPLGDTALIWLELKVIFFVNSLFTFITHTTTHRHGAKCASMFSSSVALRSFAHSVCRDALFPSSKSLCQCVNTVAATVMCTITIAAVAAE